MGVQSCCRTACSLEPEASRSCSDIRRESQCRFHQIKGQDHFLHLWDHPELDFKSVYAYVFEETRSKNQVSQFSLISFFKMPPTKYVDNYYCGILKNCCGIIRNRCSINNNGRSTTSNSCKDRYQNHKLRKQSASG